MNATLPDAAIGVDVEVGTGVGVAVGEAAGFGVAFGDALAEGGAVGATATGCCVTAGVEPEPPPPLHAARTAVMRMTDERAKRIANGLKVCLRACWTAASDRRGMSVTCAISCKTSRLLAIGAVREIVVRLPLACVFATAWRFEPKVLTVDQDANRSRRVTVDFL
jgi:hypothetical protein